MRKKIVAGNWKMNLLHKEANDLFNTLNNASGDFPTNVEVIIAPPALYLGAFAQSVASQLKLSAQEVSAHLKQGAFTGELSSEMLKSAGLTHAIVGHSERRTYHEESDTLIGKKIKACAEAGIVPIYCCGENLEQRESNDQMSVVQSQISEAIKELSTDELKNLIVAYEPVWAIGTGKTATSGQAQEMHAMIRNFMAEKVSAEFAEKLRILYGGSCKPGNAAELFSQGDVDGGLIGGASLKVQDFMEIIKAGA
jgi:triosephosphate isomerase